MRITKSQLQEIIREELSALSEDENLDEFLGGLRRKVFGKNKKEKARDARRAQSKADQEEWDQEEAADAAGLADRKAERAAGDEARAKKAQDKKEREAYKERRAQMDRESNLRRKATSDKYKKPIEYARKTDFYGTNNRKDESQLRERIKEEVTKALKAHLKK